MEPLKLRLQKKMTRDVLIHIKKFLAHARNVYCTRVKNFHTLKLFHSHEKSGHGNDEHANFSFCTRNIFAYKVDVSHVRKNQVFFSFKCYFLGSVIVCC